MALVRDPAERFISAVGQVTSSVFSNKGSGKRLKDKCIPSWVEKSKDSTTRTRRKRLGQQKIITPTKTKTTSDVIRCFVNIIKNEGYWVDVHFTPMILEISFATMQKDVPVTIFPFEKLPDIVSELGTDPTIKRKDGQKEGYRSILLANASVDDFDSDVLQELCDLYLMDVLFMRDLGYATNCDSFL